MAVRAISILVLPDKEDMNHSSNAVDWVSTPCNRFCTPEEYYFYVVGVYENNNENENDNENCMKCDYEMVNNYDTLYFYLYFGIQNIIYV